MCDLGEAGEEGEGPHHQGVGELKPQKLLSFTHVYITINVITWGRGWGLNINIEVR